LTRKHYVVLAEEISKLLDKRERLAAAVSVAAACLKMNPRFDSQKFFEACKV
jgi:hypothetical protein